MLNFEKFRFIFKLKYFKLVFISLYLKKNKFKINLILRINNFIFSILCLILKYEYNPQFIEY
jgi:hypothetical protein